VSRRRLAGLKTLGVLLCLAAAPAARAAGVSTWLGGGWWLDLVQYQTDLHRQLAGALRGLREGDPTHAALVLGGLSLFYGVLHAAGPGHGKAIISSYLVADERSIRSGIVLSFAAALTQAASAVLIVLIGSFALGLAGFQLTRLAAHAETASFCLVAALGIGMAFTGAAKLARQLRPVAAHAGHNHDEHHEHDDACGHDHAPQLPPPGRHRLLRSAGVVLAVGMRPCTGALIVLVFALVNGLFLAGIAATLAMALGTAVTVSALAALSLQAKQMALRLFASSHHRLELVSGFLWLGGGLLVAGLGVAFLLTPTRAAPF
jgi:nickel/cobalt exporter